MQMLYRLSYVGLLDTKTREGEPETGLLEVMEQSDPTPENLLRVRM